MIIEIEQDRSTPTETQPLLKPIVVQPLRLLDIPTAIKCRDDAFANDTLNRYLRAGDDDNTASQKASKIIRYSFEVFTKVAWTIEHGSAVIVATFPRRNPALEYLFGLLVKALDMISRPTAEREKRLDEVIAKRTQVNKEAGIDDRDVDYVYIERLFVSPTLQGGGYGSKLVKTVTDQCDASGQTCWLHAIAANETFYIIHGFTTIASVVIGDGNPEWHEEPVLVNLVPKMVREPKPEIKKSENVQA